MIDGRGNNLRLYVRKLFSQVPYLGSPWFRHGEIDVIGAIHGHPEFNRCCPGPRVFRRWPESTMNSCMKRSERALLQQHIVYCISVALTVTRSKARILEQSNSPQQQPLARRLLSESVQSSSEALASEEIRGIRL